MDLVLRNKKTFAISIIVVAVLIALVGTFSYKAGASIPDASKKINACYRTNGGDLRVIDTANSTDTCSNKETALSWYQKPPVDAAMGRVENGQLVTSGLKNVTRWSAGLDSAHNAYGNVENGYCLEVPFTPYIEYNYDAQGNNKHQLVFLNNTISAATGLFDQSPDSNPFCGPGYNVFVVALSNDGGNNDYAFIIN